MKGTIKSGFFANIKTMDGSALFFPLAMQEGDYAYGDRSPTGSDLMNFDHFYRSNGLRVELMKMCKANALNMIFENVSETPPPPPPPVVDDVVSIVSSVVTYKRSDGSTGTKTLIPE